MDQNNYTMVKDFVSVIIPTYNGKDYLCETIQSAISQTYPKKEIILVDDGSEYDLSELLSPYMDKITLIRQKNKGPGAARKLGVLKSTGEFIAFLDHDDLWAPDKIETQVSLIKSNKECGLVYAYPILIDSKGDVIPNESPSYFPEGNVFDQFLKKNRITTFSATLLKKEVYNAVGGIDEDLKYETCDDYDLWLRISSKYIVRYSPNSKVYYRIHSSNLMKTYEKNLFAHSYVLEKINRKIISKKCGKEKTTLNRTLKHNLFEHYKKYAFSYYYDHQKVNNSEIAKKLFKKVLLIEFDIKVFIYYLLSFKTTTKSRATLRKLREKFYFFKLLFEPKELSGKIKKKIWLYREKKRNSEEYYQYMLRYSGVKIGKDCQIMRSVIFADPVLVEIGNNVLVSGGVKFLTHDGAPMLFKDEIGPKFIYGPITVGSNVFIGMNAIINKGVSIGNNVIVGAGSVVNKSIPSNTIVMGNPAKTVFKMSIAEKMMKNNKNLLENKHTLNSIKDIDEKIINHFKLSKNNFDEQFYLFSSL